MAEHYFYKRNVALSSIANGRTKLEVHVASPMMLRVRNDDTFVFFWKYRRRVTDIRFHSTFAHTLRAEKPGEIMPGWTEDKILEDLRRVHGEREKLGVLVFELEVGT